MTRQPKSLLAEARFRARVADLGGVVLEPAWLGSQVRHRVRCVAGHEWAARPNNVQQGEGICGICARNDPASAETAFRVRVADLGEVVLEPAWLGALTRHRVRCVAGHDCSPKPNAVQQGQGICRACAGKDPVEAERLFRARVAELGGVVLESAWLGNKAPHRVRCAAGHECHPRPNDLTLARGGRPPQGLCRICAHHDPATAEAAFRARLAELGATLLEPVWLGANCPHRVRCAAGHDCSPKPNGVKQGDGICRLCANAASALARLSATTEARFRELLTIAGATLLEPYRGRHYPTRVRCSLGHEVTPQPGSVIGGTGICRMCAGQTWDVFYVVTTAAGDRLKFGITSGDPRGRLKTHRTFGYRNMALLLTGLPDGVAPEIERSVMAALALAGERPIRGREYFDAGALGLVVDIASNYPIPGVAA